MSSAVTQATFSARRARQHRQAEEAAEFYRLIDRVASLDDGQTASDDDVAALARLMEPGGLPEALRHTLTNLRRATKHGDDFVAEDELAEAVRRRRNLRECRANHARCEGLRAQHEPPEKIERDVAALRAEIAKRMRELVEPLHKLEGKLGRAKSAIAQAEYAERMVGDALAQAPWLAKCEESR